MIRKRSILVWNNGKSQRTIIHALGCALPETYINHGQEGLAKLYSMLEQFFKEPERVHTCPAVATTHQREEWTHHPRGAVVTDTDDIDSNDKDIVMPPLI